MIFLTVVLPTSLIFLIGYVLMKQFQLDIQTLSKITFYCLLPILVFRTLYQANLKEEIGIIFLFELILMYLLILLVKIIVWVKKDSTKRESTLILSSVFMNSGNYGAPIILFAFGEKGFQLAITFWVIQSIFMNSFGVYFAAKDKDGLMQSLKTVSRMPAIYAAIIGLASGYFNVEYPLSLLRPVDLLANATIPILMLTLGMQLAKVKFNVNWEPVSLSIVLRLVISPLLAWGIVHLFSIEGLLAKVLILEAAMPTAVVATLLAVQYDREPDIVSNATLTSTILSTVTLSVLLYMLI
jgi:predicted permease